MKHFTCSILLSLFLGPFLSAQTSKDVDNQTIIDKVLATYANLPYYMDSTVIFRETKSKKPYHKAFSTAFIRDHYFEIQGESFNPYRKASVKAGYYYEKNKDLSLSWIRFGEEPLKLDTSTLDRGLVNLLVTDLQAVNSIASLLVSDSLKRQHELKDFSRLYRQTDEFIDGEACYVLDLYFPADTMAAISPVRSLIEAIPMSVSTRQYRYWVRKSDFLILKYDYQRTRNKNKTRGTIRIYPQPRRAPELKPRPFLYGE